MNKYYYRTPSKKFDTLLCTIGKFAIRVTLLIAVSKMVGQVADMLISKEEKDSPTSDPAPASDQEAATDENNDT